MTSKTASSLKSYDDLFDLDDNTSEQGNTPTTISINRLKPFEKHPFKGYSDDKLNSLAQSIKEQGVKDFILKKEAEGKPKKVVKIAALNKFLRIYYARCKEV